MASQPVSATGYNPISSKHDCAPTLRITYVQCVWYTTRRQQGVTSDIAAVRQAIDAAGHPALLLVDTISGLAAADYRHDEWGVDVSISGSQKGLMLPPGLGFNAVSPKALAASKQATFPKAFLGWHEMIEMNRTGYWPTATQAAVRVWGLAIQCAEPSVYSPILTGVMMPGGVDADEVRKLIYERYDCSLGTGLGKVKGAHVPYRTPRRLRRPHIDHRHCRVRDGVESGWCGPTGFRRSGSDGRRAT